jgi:hypothetical protein
LNPLGSVRITIVTKFKRRAFAIDMRKLDVGDEMVARKNLPRPFHPFFKARINLVGGKQ